MAVVFSPEFKSFFTAREKPSYDDNSGFFLNGENGALVILIHGLTGTPAEMRSIAAFLNRKGYSVICPRLAYHGGPIETLKMAHWQDFYESVRRVLSKGKFAGFDGPIFASGLSMGSLLALLLADEFKPRVSAVSCLAPTLFYDGWNTPVSKYLLPLVVHTPLKYLFYFKEEPPYGIKNEIIRERIHRYYKNATLKDIGNADQYGYPYFPVSLLHQLQLLVKYLTKRLSKISFPVQLIQARDDDMTSIKNSKFIYDKIKSKTKEIILLHDSYHVITADQERDIVAEKVEGFFSKVKKCSNA